MKKKLKLISIAVTALLFLWTLPSFAQSRTVKGLVKDDKNNLLPRVSIQVVGTNTVGVTDEQGAFSILVPSPNSVLLFSFVGMSNTEVALNGRTELLVTILPLNIADIQDVVVVGYGTQRKVTVTGSVVQIKGADLAKSPTINLSNALVGRLPGITAIQASGEPGADGSRLLIRGTNTLGNTSALIVIDGVPDRAGGLERLNPSDIENFSVLKDGSAAIYGARAANGVMLITTKRGKVSSPSLTYDFNYGFSQPTHIPKMMDATQYATANNELTMFSGVPSNQWTAAWEALKTAGSYTRTDGAGAVVNAPYKPADIVKHGDGSDIWKFPNTDWFGDALRPWAPQLRHNLQYTGGTETVKYFASLGYLSQDGIYKNSATKFKQYDFRVNLDVKINKYINTSLGISGREEARNFPTVGASDIFRMLMRGKPTEPELWPNGLPGPDIENGQNPAVITTNQTGYTKSINDYFQSTGKIEFTIPGVTGLRLSGIASADLFTNFTKKWETPWSLYFWDKKTYGADGVTPVLTKSTRSTFTDPRLTQANTRTVNIMIGSMLNYDIKFGDHSFGFLAALTKETVKSDFYSSFKRNFISSAIDQFSVGGAIGQNITGSAFPSARLSYFGRVQYNFKEKYLAELVWRTDGSYIFPESRRFGFFPGLLLGWNISRENFMKNVSFVDNLKLRASYGRMGNDQVFYNGQLQEYAFLSLYAYGLNVFNDKIMQGLYEIRLRNSHFTWESANNSNIGIEGTLFNKKINFEFDYFYNRRTQILWQSSGHIPGSAGVILPPENFGKVANRGFEFLVGYTGVVNKDLKFTASLSGGYAKNKVLYFKEEAGAQPYQFATGKGFGTSSFNYFVYEYAGVFIDQADIDQVTKDIDYAAVTKTLRPGDMKFRDVNDDKKINYLDQVRADKNRDPRFTGGLNLGVKYKTFELGILLQGAMGGAIRIGTQSGDYGNFLKSFWDNRWSVESPSSIHPRLANRDNTYYTNTAQFGSNTYWLRSSDYLRLKNVELSYSLPKSIIEKAGLKGVRIHANTTNLATWDKLKDFDPEAVRGDGLYYPQSRIINVGLNVTF